MKPLILYYVCRTVGTPMGVRQGFTAVIPFHANLAFDIRRWMERVEEVRVKSSSAAFIPEEAYDAISGATLIGTSEDFEGHPMISGNRNKRLSNVLAHHPGEAFSSSTRLPGHAAHEFILVEELPEHLTYTVGKQREFLRQGDYINLIATPEHCYWQAGMDATNRDKGYVQTPKISRSLIENLCSVLR